MKDKDDQQVSLVITAEEIRRAPPDVRRWFQSLIGAAEPGEQVLEHNGFQMTDRNIAILDEREARVLLAHLEGDTLALQVLTQFADDCWQAASGRHVACRVPVADIVHRTDLPSPRELRPCFDRIETALRRIRQDDRVLLFEGNAHLGYSVHPISQAVLHHLRMRRAESPAAPAERPKGIGVMTAEDRATRVAL